MSAPWLDMEREEGTLMKVTTDSDGKWYSVYSSNGWACSVDGKHGVAPKVGDQFVTWGGLGYPIRGQAINGHVLYYRTPDEQRAKELADAEARKLQQAAEYEATRGAMDTRLRALPIWLRERVRGFRTRGGEPWRYQFEGYELMCCEEAVKLAERFPEPEALMAFAKLPGYDEQTAAFPEMEPGHSGNSWSASIAFARLLLEEPELLPKAHGALCGLVGCEDYHCWATVVTAGAA